MRKIITYTLLILVLIAFNYKTLSVCLKQSNSISFVQDYDCEEKSDSKKADEKNEKKDFPEYLFINKVRSVTIPGQLSFTQRYKLTYNGFDYSMAVYSPPWQVAA